MSTDNRIHELNALALDPQNTVVIEACAGSGKTWLLVSRIIRLLLDGVSPSEILAITFTRKAAQEMQARLHQWLHLLATSDDDEVRKFLRDREVPEQQLDDALSRARALFEDLLTDQPGITINTFHGWFLQLLKRAPLAAGAAGGTNLAEQTSSLIYEAWEVFAQDLQDNDESPVAHALNWLFENYGLASTRSLLTNFLAKRAEWWAYTRGAAEGVAEAMKRLRSQMPVAPDEDVVSALFSDPVFSNELAEYADLLSRNETATDVALAEKLRTAAGVKPDQVRFEQVCSVLHTNDGKLRIRKASKKAEDRLGADGQNRLLSLHAGLGNRLAAVREMLVEQSVYRFNEAGLLCGEELLNRYQSIKHERGLIDYTDVEWRTWLLLTTSDYAEYMHYRLDARYKHILLDEFQDTNPLQWQIMRTWLEASADVQSRPRLFVVGDPKQSIYRFRRAEPRLFDVVRRYLQKFYGAQVLEQNVTRRNAPAVVSVVNTVFGGMNDGFTRHEPYRESLPGAVRVLPLSAPEQEEPAQPERWRNPLDAARVDAIDRRRERESDALASHINEMVGCWQIVDGDSSRPLRFQDIYVLVRKRTHLEVYERSLRRAQIPHLSSHQGGLLNTLEAADLTALLKFLVVPFADIHLATALRSPLFSLSDGELMLVSAAEGRTWWQRLSRLATDAAAKAPPGSDAIVRARRLLGGWMSLVDQLPVHDLLDRIYFEADVINRYEAAVPAAMRAAVAANLRAFLEVALSTNSGRYPSLQGFLHELASMQRGTAEEAPDIGAIAEDLDAVRILTVHGAKGLEAPVVWLVDANAGPNRSDSYDVLVDWPPEEAAPAHFSLFSRKDERGASREQLFQQDAALAAREDLNLLYVAMTRAQQVFLASGSEAPERGESWYARIEKALSTVIDMPDFPATQPGEVAAVASTSEVPDAAGYGALHRALNVGQRSDDPLDPRRRSGTLVHALLEKCVPPHAIDDCGFLRQMLGVSDAEFDILWKSARSIIDEPSLSRFFNPDDYLRAFNELQYVSANGELRRIDRVVEFSDEIWVLDYKTGETTGAADLRLAARPYLKQLTDYRAAVSELLPGKPVRSALIFSGGLIYEA